MSKVRFTGEIVQQGSEFTVKVEITLPSLSEAQQFGERIHGMISELVQAKGGTLTKAEGSPPASPIIRPN